MRWRHPQLGNVSPGEFVPLIEQTALARDMTDWVIAAALQQQVAWRQAGIELCVSINVSVRNLEEPDFAQRVAAQLDLYNLPAQAIELEFTESALMHNPDKVMANLHAIQARGTTIAINDFGTGYSNFNYLWKIPAHSVKLDRSFLQEVETRQKDRDLAVSMITMAHDLGFQVVAEGVETQATLDFLIACGCDEIQGYLTGRPASPEASGDWLKRTEAATFTMDFA